MSLPFLEAFRQMKKGKISWEDYIHNILARTKGVKHEEDNQKFGHWELMEKDPFGYSIYCWSNRIDEVEDTTPFENVFKAYRSGTLDDIKERLAVLDNKQAREIRKSLSFLALQERRADVLEWSLKERDFPYEEYFEKEANRLGKVKDAETYKVIEQSDFRELYPLKPGKRRPR